jgi:FecR protein
MSRYRWTPALLLMVLVAMRLTASSAEPAIGVAASTKPDAESVVGQNSQTLSAGSELRANETVRTGNNGRADLIFLDNTNLTVGPTSEVLLDKFVYDPMGSSGKVVLNVTRGTFRFITGSQASRVYAIKTPYGTLGVRGTVAEMKVLPGMVRKVARPGECVVLVRLAEGAGVTFTTNAGVVHALTQVGTCGCLTADGNWVVQACPALFAEAPPPPPPPPPPGGGQSPNCVPQNTPTVINCP